jgi:hypothetical protein
MEIEVMSHEGVLQRNYGTGCDTSILVSQPGVCLRS